MFAFAPPMAMLLMFSTALPGLERLTSIGLLATTVDWEPKLIRFGLMTACGAVPVPDSGTSCGDPAALSVKLNEPLDAVAVAGVNTTLTLQVAAGAS